MRVYWEIYGERRADGAAAAHLVDRPLAASGRCRSRTWPATSASSPSTAAATGAPTGPSEPAAYAERSSRRTRWPCWTRPGPSGGARRLLARRAARLSARRRAPGAGARRLVSSGPRPVRAGRGSLRASAMTRARPQLDSRTRAGRSSTRHYWLQRLRRLRRVLLRQMFPEPHSTKQIEDCVALGPRDDARDAASRAQLVAAAAPARDGCASSHCRACAARSLVVHGTDDEITPRRRAASAGRADGRRARPARGRGHAPHARDPVPVNLLLREFVERASGGRRTDAPARATPRAARGGRCTSPRRSGSATRGATSRSPTSCARSSRISRSTGSPSTRSPACSTSAGERIHPASARPRERVGAHRVRGGRARPALLPGDPADGRDPGRQLHGLPRRRRATSATTSGSATRPGSSTTSCTRTRELKRAPYAWLTDFVGWLPMPRRRASARRS